MTADTTDQNRIHTLMRRPPEALSQDVALLWAWASPAVPRLEETKLPSGQAQVVVDVTAARALVEGPHTAPRRMTRGGPAWLGVGAVLRPRGLVRLLDVAAVELHDALVPLEAVWPAAGWTG